MRLEEIARTAPPETVTNVLRWVPQTFAQALVDAEGRPPVYETDDLKLWHVPTTVLGYAFTVTVVISGVGSTLSCRREDDMYLSMAIAAEMKQIPMVSHTRH